MSAPATGTAKRGTTTPFTVAVMQPYFYPYAGYYRLLAAADTFVLFDDVQFPRRGRVHRCEVPGPTGALEWLTLPLARQSRHTKIMELAFAANARASLDRRLARHRWLAEARGPWAERLRAQLHGPLDGVPAFLEAGIRLVAEALDLPARLIRSSSLTVDPALRGQDRVIAIVRALGGRRYVNAPGGRTLYRAEAFHRAGLELHFLPPYPGSRASILPTLASGPIDALRAEMRNAAPIAANRGPVSG